MSVSCQTRLVVWSRLTKSAYQHLQKVAVINLLAAIFLFIFSRKGPLHFTNKTHIMDGPIWFGDLK